MMSMDDIPNGCEGCDKREELIAELNLELEELKDPNWQTYVCITERWLQNYPADIFTGVSGDPGPLFVVAVRKAMTALQIAGK